MRSEAATSAVPNPGSDEATARGCTCPVIDNSHGRGYLGTGQFWVTDGCPVHAPRASRSLSQEGRT